MSNLAISLSGLIYYYIFKLATSEEVVLQLVKVKRLLDSFNLLVGSLAATLVATSALERRILNLKIELNLRLCT